MGYLVVARNLQKLLLLSKFRPEAKLSFGLFQLGQMLSSEHDLSLPPSETNRYETEGALLSDRS